MRGATVRPWPALVLAVGCVEPAASIADGGCSSNGVTVVLGRGNGGTAGAFTPMRDGDEHLLTPGSQGAQHLWIDLQTRGLDPAQPRITLRVYGSDGALLGELRQRLGLQPATDGADEVRSLPLVLENDRYCAALRGRVRVVAAVDDLVGHCGSTERTLQITGIDPRASAAEVTVRVRCCELRLLRCFPGDAATALDEAG